MEPQIQSLDSLHSILSDYQIDYSHWGQNATKSIEKLWEEIELDETSIRIEEGEISRVVSVANVYVKYKSAEGECLQLWEDRQVFTNGDVRKRDGFNYIAEKGYSSEDKLEWAARALKEELQIGIPKSRIQILGDEIKLGKKTSYPGLKSKYHVHEFEVLLAEDEFKQEGYVEEQKDKKTYFVWR